MHPPAVPLAGQFAADPQRLLPAVGRGAGGGVRVYGGTVLRSMCGVRYVAARPDRRADPGEFRGSGRRPGSGLFQRHADGGLMMITAFCEAQLLLLVFVFLLACVGKLASPKDRQALLFA